MVASKSKARKVGGPQPGRAVRGSSTGRPIMALLDLLGRRWSLRVLWELRTGESLTFRELQARCAEVSSSVLNDRLRELREAGIVTAAAGRGYSLTPDGARLLQDLEPLDDWARRWGRRSARAEATSAGPPINSAAPRRSSSVG
jgi:DNA-binding HxlR family transcriptional regulator